MLALIAIFVVIIVTVAIFRYPVIILAIFLTTALVKAYLLLNVGLFQKVDYTVLCACLLLISMACHFIKTGCRLKNITSAPLGLFLALAGLLLFGILYTSAPVYGFQKGTRVAAFGLILFLAPIVFTHNLKDIRSMIWTLLVVGIIVAVGTIAAPHVTGESGVSRTGFLESDAITTGEIIGIAAIIAFIFALMANTSKRLRIISIVLIPVMILAIIFTGSRGPLLGLGFVWLAAMLICHREMSKSWQALILGVIIVALIISFIKLPEEVTSRITKLVSQSYNYGIGEAARTRTDMVLWATAQFSKHPILGHGTGSFAMDYEGQDKRSYPHNIIIESLYEQGLAGGIILILFLWLIFRRWRLASTLVRLYEMDIEIFQAVHIAGLLFLFSTIQAMKSGDLDGNRFLFFSSGLVVAVLDMVRRRAEEISAENQEQSEENSFEQTGFHYQ